MVSALERIDRAPTLDAKSFGDALSRTRAAIFARSLLVNEWTTPWTTLSLSSVRSLSLVARASLVLVTTLYAAWISERRPAEAWRAWSALVAVSVLVSPLAWEGTHAMVIFSLALAARRVSMGVSIALFSSWAIERAIDLFFGTRFVADAVRSHAIVSSCLVWATLALLFAIVFVREPAQATEVAKD